MTLIIVTYKDGSVSKWPYSLNLMMTFLKSEDLTKYKNVIKIEVY